MRRPPATGCSTRPSGSSPGAASQGVTTRQITEAAEQRNTSAVSYHFGSREGLLLEILARRGGPIDEERGRRRDALGADPPLRDLVACLVEPYAALLGDQRGPVLPAHRRAAARPVRRVAGRVRRRDHGAPGSRSSTRSRPACDAGAAVRQERVLALIMVLTGTTAERARRLDEDAETALGHDEFVEHLTGICTAIIRG